VIETNAPFLIETGRLSQATWAIKNSRRRPDLARLVCHAIIRLRPLVLLNGALLVCAATGAGMYLAATYALGAAT
jgi:hypothetical protein